MLILNVAERGSINSSLVLDSSIKRISAVMCGFMSRWVGVQEPLEFVRGSRFGSEHKVEIAVQI